MPSAACISLTKLCSWVSAILEYQSHLIIGCMMLCLSNRQSNEQKKRPETLCFSLSLGACMFIPHLIFRRALFGASIIDFNLVCFILGTSSPLAASEGTAKYTADNPGFLACCHAAKSLSGSWVPCTSAAASWQWAVIPKQHQNCPLPRKASILRLY